MFKNITSTSINQIELKDSIPNRMMYNHKPSETKAIVVTKVFKSWYFPHSRFRVKLNEFRGKILEVLKVRTI